MNNFNKNKLCCLASLDGIITIDSKETPVPQYDKICLPGYSNKEISFFTVNDVCFTTNGVFYNHKLIVESCHLGQYPIYMDNHMGDQYVEESFPLDLFDRQSIYWDEVFYCCLNFDINYQHFLIESLPKIYLASMLSDSIPIVVDDIPFIREILSYLVPEKRLLYIQRKTVFCKCKKLHIIPSVGTNCSDLNNLQVSSLKKLRESVLSKSLKTDAIINDIAYYTRLAGNIIGSSRYIENFAQVETLLDKFSISICDFGDLTLTEKCSIASLYKYQITPIGANLMNYIFVTGPMTLFVIDHPYYNDYGLNFFRHVYQALELPIDYNILNITHSEHDCTPDNNVPYLIDCVKLDHFLCDFMAQLSNRVKAR